MILYAETSSVLGWLLGEPGGPGTREALAGAEIVASSSLTVLECARGILHARHAGRIKPQAAEELRGLLLCAVSTWFLHEVDAEVLERAAESFPVEPVRTLDAVHLATMCLLHERVGGIALLSADERIRANAEALGIPVAL